MTSYDEDRSTRARHTRAASCPLESGAGMAFDNRKLRLRRFEIQIVHHAAYLFWNLKGILAEKWGHGPHFGAYSHDADRLQLTQKAGEPTRMAAVSSLRGSAFFSEDEPYAKAVEVAQPWLADCYDVLQPQVVKSLHQKISWAYPVRDPDRTNDKVMK